MGLRRKPDEKSPRAKKHAQDNEPIDPEGSKSMMSNYPSEANKWRIRGVNGSKCLVIQEKDIKSARKSLRASNAVSAIIYAICGIILAYCGWQLGTYLYEVSSAQGAYDDITYEYSQQVIGDNGEDIDDSLLPPVIDFDELKSINPDVAGWLRIPGTTVDYPIMTNSEKDYYLHRDFKGDYSYSGSIFADYQNTNDLSQYHIVLYGHHMIPPTMFHDVANYADESFFDSHRTIYLETPSTCYVLKAIGLYTADPTEYMTRQVLFNDANTFQGYLDERLSRRATIAYDDYDRKTCDKLVTLITCNNKGKTRQVLECVVEQEYPTSDIPNVIQKANSSQ